jgi:hypothetical protein
MEDRKTRIAKLSERFKPQTGRQKLSPKQRERKSYYLDTEIGLDHGVGHFRLLSITRQRHYEHCNEP